MAINGVETVIFGATDTAELIRFFDDFGLVRSAGGDATAADYVLPEGSKVLIRRSDDPSLPPRFLSSDGPREIIWGTTDQASLDAIEKELKRDREVIRDPDGTLHSQDPNGLRVGFRVFDRKPLPEVEPVENSLTHQPRRNTPRKWYERARPKLIQHVVFATEGIQAALDFYVGRLNFRISDVSRGRGVFLRCDGRHEHHNLFFVNRPLAFNHMALGVDSIDELMAGATYMQRKGWKSNFGLGRHRISSIVFFYLSCPTGGEIEYAADGDYIDDAWQPSLWDPAFGNHHWTVRGAESGSEVAKPDVVPLPNPIPPFAQLR
jgi:catechol 2,3-dioxygenase-like lactoylglutathione lyase family enzyme